MELFPVGMFWSSAARVLYECAYVDSVQHVLPCANDD